MLYTLTKLKGSLIEAKSVESNERLSIDTKHERYEKVVQYANAGKLLSISERGTWSGRKDYEGFYKAATKASPTSSKAMSIKLTRLDDLKFNESLFIPMPTHTPVDKFLSNDGGFMPGCNIMAAGAPGVGKTTVLLEMLYKVQQNSNKKVLFISAEMNQLDMARYLKRFPHWGQLPILFLSDYTDADPQKVIESTLKQGWDLVLTDSYTEVNDTVKEECNLTRSKTEKWFLDLMIANNQGKNKLNLYTTFVTILQIIKRW